MHDRKSKSEADQFSFLHGYIKHSKINMGTQCSYHKKYDCNQNTIINIGLNYYNNTTTNKMTVRVTSGSSTHIVTTFKSQEL